MSSLRSSPRRWGALGALLIGCGSAPVPRHADHDLPGIGPAVAVRASGPLGLELAVLTARGELAVLHDRAWRPLAAGATSARVRELKVARQGAIVALGAGDAAGRLWLRAGSHVRLGQDDRGGVHVAVLAGEARLRRGEAALPVFVDLGGAARPVTGDFLLAAAATGQTELIATGARPELADWSLDLEQAELGAGVGKLEARIDDQHSEPLVLRRVAVDVHTAGDLAVTEVEHVFFNPAGETREGTFRFPVPEGGMLIGMAMEINGRLVEGEIVEREKARATYQQIVDEMQDPALLEWEQGNWFKLRVFPIEGRHDKRVVIRYLTPLVHRADRWEYDFALGRPDLGTTIGELTVTVDGKVAAREQAVHQGLDLTVPVAASQVPVVMREVRTDGVYTAVRITPAAAGMSVPAAPTGERRVAVVFDTSRSTLESRPLALELLRTTLGELAPGDRFVVLASDVAVTPSSADFVAAAPAAQTAALGFVAAIEPDGASDLGAALTAAAALHPTDVLYIGDGIATWGDRDGPALAAKADAIGAPIHAALLGKGAAAAPWRDLAGRTGGRAMMVTRSIDARRFALAAVHARAVPRLASARVEAPSGAAVFPDHATTVYAGDDLLAVIRTPAGEPAPAEVTLVGVAGGQPYRQRVSLASAVAVPRVGQRWAARQLAALEARGAPRDEIVKLSQEAGVMSRYTSLLVLENDDAYRQHQIERKHAEEQLAQAPQVTGGDLDNLGARQASLSPDEIQPGDPEIKIPAPRDAVSVVVTFPFGETKQAVWDGDLAAWMVRFLIDKDTADGGYQVRVAITHADGRVEVLHLGYTVDTVAPAVELSATRVAGGYRIRARQRGEARRDADQVELVLPDGQLLVLAQTSWGKFEAVWVTGVLPAPVTLRVVARDRALNLATRELTVAP